MTRCFRAGIGTLAISIACLIASAGTAVADQAITSAGPLTRIYLGELLDCQADYTGDLAHSFFGEEPGACGTFIAPEGTEATSDVYGPDVPAGLERIPYEPVSQTAVTGVGTGADPYRVVTVVDVGETGLRIAQTDSYVSGEEVYRTDIEVQNLTEEPVAAVLYHAGDCYLQDSDEGFGFLDSVGGGIYCSENPSNDPPGRIVGFAPISGGSQFVEGEYEDDVWTGIDGTPFLDTCNCDVLEDNGAGISWEIGVPALGSVSRSLLTVFSPSGEPPPPPTGPPTSLVLSPGTAINAAGEEHCVTATVTDASDSASPDVTVLFSVTGANDASGTAQTDAGGEARFCYTGTRAGDDAISAFADVDGNGSDDGAADPDSGAAKTYVAAAPAQLALSPSSATNVVDTSHCVSASVEDAFGNPTGGVPVRFSITGARPASGAATTNAGGNAQFCYPGPALPGTDSIAAFADTDGGGTPNGAEPSGSASKRWTLPRTDCGVKVTGGGWIVTGGGRAHFSGNVKTKKKSGLDGNLRYSGPGISVRSTDILVMTCSPDRTRATVFGFASVNGSGSRLFRVDETDRGEPGRNDTYRIRVDTGYDSGAQRLGGGNIQIHKK